MVLMRIQNRIREIGNHSCFRLKQPFERLTQWNKIHLGTSKKALLNLTISQSCFLLVQLVRLKVGICLDFYSERDKNGPVVAITIHVHNPEASHERSERS